jgi:hypothetical protein
MHVAPQPQKIARHERMRSGPGQMAWRRAQHLR